MHWSEVWHSQRPGPRLVRTALVPLSWLYAAGWECYQALYESGIKKAREPHCPIVCVGNLVAGGSGKSPVTLYLAKVLQGLGKEVVIGCSGYGSPRSEDANLAPDGPLDAKEWGDEPAMLRWLCPDVPLIVGRDRVRAAKICHRSYPSAVLLMDDGFQHLPLKKQITILLDPPCDNPFCLPAGPYREPRRHRSRATLVLPNGFKTTFAITGFESGSGLCIANGTSRRVNVLCAIGRPERFLSDLVSLGLEIDTRVILSDHDPLDRGNLFEPFKTDLPVVVTAKDWVKLQRRSDLQSIQWMIARQEATIEPEAGFREWLAQKLDELSNESPPR